MYSLQQIAEITNSLFFGSSDKNITVFLTDSRALQTASNTLFIALKTNRNNGHNFIVELIDKGVTVSQVAQVADHFTQAGILVHAYLMYGFPTQTAHETVDSLEVVRQLVENGVVHSGFWHQFALTAHSPVGINPDAYQIKILNPEPGSFANNDLFLIGIPLPFLYFRNLTDNKSKIEIRDLIHFILPILLTIEINIHLLSSILQIELNSVIISMVILLCFLYILC